MKKILFILIFIIAGCAAEKPNAKFVSIPGRNWDKDKFECIERSSIFPTNNFKGMYEMCMKGKGYKTIEEINSQRKINPPENSNWQQYSKNDRGDIFYYDPVIYFSPEGLPGFWVMQSFGVFLRPSGTAPASGSGKTFYEIKCEAKAIRSYVTYFYSEKMGRGDDLGGMETLDIDWKIPAENSPFSLIAKNICNTVSQKSKIQ